MNNPAIILILGAVLIFCYGLVSRLAERSPITAPMVFVAIGILASPMGTGILSIKIDAGVVQIIASVTLVLVLFVDASSISVPALIRERRLPMRLLLIGLPLTMLFGSIAGFLIFQDMRIWVVLLMALILSPTDAALGQAVVTNPAIPERIRRAINVESGLNDGMALPPILVCIAALSEAGTGDRGTDYWINFTLKQLILGPIAGIFVGWLGGLLVDKASRAGWMNETYQRMSSASLAVIAYAAAESMHGNGFMAAFFSGLALGTRTPSVRERIHEFAEAEGQQLALFIFLMLGLILVPVTIQYWDIRAWMYAVLSLTVIRMLPVALSLMGSKLDWASVSFIGWFGPRGIASILYLLIVVGRIGKSGYEYMLSVIVLTVLLSVFLHGISAVPLAHLYGRYASKHGMMNEEKPIN
jgi:NhaP-type Na+/H+ or K+/H+ antiporter